jgi:hypothetical protein
VLIDTNLLLLLVVGSVALDRVGSVGRTEQFDEAAYDRLVSIVSNFRYTVTTPHVLCETSNLLCKGADHELADALRCRLHHIYILSDERFVTARKLSSDTLAAPFGLADTAIIEAAKRGCTVISTDAGLCGELRRRGLQVFNFNHLRFENLS